MRHSFQNLKELHWGQTNSVLCILCLDLLVIFKNSVIMHAVAQFLLGPQHKHREGLKLPLTPFSLPESIFSVRGSLQPSLHCAAGSVWTGPCMPANWVKKNGTSGQSLGNHDLVVNIIALECSVPFHRAWNASWFIEQLGTMKWSRKQLIVVVTAQSHMSTCTWAGLLWRVFWNSKTPIDNLSPSAQCCFLDFHSKI